MSSQPAVSLQIRTLEDELGVKLFERRGPKISLTRAGASLYQYAMPLVQAMDRLPDTFAEERIGRRVDSLTIGAGPTSALYLLPRYLKRFRERFPGVRVNVRTGCGSQRLQWLRGYELDLIVSAMDEPPKDLRFHEMAVSRFLLITPRDHPLSGRMALEADDLHGHRFVGYLPGRHLREVGDALMRQLGIEPDFGVEVDGWSDIKLYVAAGLGVSFVPEICVTERDALWSTPIDQYLPPRRYGALTRNDGLVSLEARQFLETLSAEDEDGSRASETGAR